MQDRISLYPGRVTLTPVSGQDNTYDMERADSPTQEGTALSKANLLTDETAENLGLDSTATPNDALARLASARVRIGDTRTTARTDLGDDWLLCNGESISSADYPELANLLVSISPQYKNITVNLTLTQLIYSGGYWVAIGTTSNSRYVTIAYTQDLNGTWTTKNLINTSSSDTISNPHIAYDDSQGWVAVISKTGTGTTGVLALYSTTLDGTWQSKQIYYGDYFSEYFLERKNGYWVTGGYYMPNEDDRYSVIAYATSPSENWTVKTISRDIRSIDYGNGYWCATDSNMSGILYATSLSGSWIYKSIVSTTAYSMANIKFANEKWVIAFAGSSSGSSFFVSYATNPTGTWTTETVTMTGFSVPLYVIEYINGKWYIGGNNSSVVSSSDLTNWNLEPVDGAWRVLSIVSNGSLIVYAGNASGSTSGNLYFLDNSTVSLPTISGDLYTYIKAKE